MNNEEERSHLHGLLEQLGINIDILQNLEKTLLHIEQRYIDMGRALVFGAVVVAVAVVAALLIGGIALHSVSTAQSESIHASSRADAATASLAKVSAENRDLIERLERVAVGAQEQGRKTDLQQCREINSLKKTIRGVLALGDRSRPLIPRFEDRDCAMLPNREPVTP